MQFTSKGCTFFFGKQKIKVTQLSASLVPRTATPGYLGSVLTAVDLVGVSENWLRI